MANKELELKQEKVRLEETIQTVKALIQGVDSLEAVSYTHLDVYKRQVVWRYL